MHINGSVGTVWITISIGPVWQLVKTLRFRQKLRAPSLLLGGEECPCATSAPWKLGQLRDCCEPDATATLFVIREIPLIGTSTTADEAAMAGKKLSQV
mmetsp:Transcript_3790/g.9963  ORF Transcript_3790/g.9963 Transcript_3790/m.9963 type:complete len:98 (+) Transcript_3790:47-340(+)